MSEDEKEKKYPNLVNFKPGQSGNPKGRPIGAKTGLRARLMQLAGKRPTSNILEMLRQEGIELEDNENAEALAEVIYSQALHGDIQSAKLIAEQTESPMPKDINLTGDMIVHIGDKDAGNL